MTNKTTTRILNRVAHCGGATSIGLLAQDLGLTDDTVRRHVKRLIVEGRLEYTADGVGLALTVAEMREREIDARVASHR